MKYVYKRLMHKSAENLRHNGEVYLSANLISETTGRASNILVTGGSTLKTVDGIWLPYASENKNPYLVIKHKLNLRLIVQNIVHGRK